MKKLYVAAVQPGCALKAQRRLRLQGYEQWTPTNKSGVLLYPGYAFLFFDMEIDRWQPINSTAGVIRLLPIYREEPLPLPDDFPRVIHRLTEEGYFDDPVDQLISFQKGDQLVITSGVWEGLSGAFNRKVKGRVEIMMSLLGRSVPIKVPTHQVSIGLRCASAQG